MNRDNSLYNCIKAKKVDEDESGPRTRMVNKEEDCEVFCPWEVDYTTSRKSRRRNVNSRRRTLKELMPAISLNTREKLRTRLLELFRTEF